MHPHSLAPQHTDTDSDTDTHTHIDTDTDTHKHTHREREREREIHYIINITVRDKPVLLKSILQLDSLLCHAKYDQ